MIPLANKGHTRFQNPWKGNVLSMHFVSLSFFVNLKLKYVSHNHLNILLYSHSCLFLFPICMNSLTLFTTNQGSNRYYCFENDNLSLVMRKQTFCICENKETDQCLCFRYTDSTIPLLPRSEISRLYPSSVAVQPRLCRTWSATPKTGFLRTRLICNFSYFPFLVLMVGFGFSLYQFLLIVLQASFSRC